jgi:CheY-like chemotaxis protein
MDGPLTEEQETQIRFIRKAAQDLFELVNDLLDLAKVEAGKVVIRPVEFSAANLFGALRGMLRPLLVNPSLSLVFEDPVDVPPIWSDESKVSQILRNFISNALKFTESGEIRVSARVTADGERVVFSVADTGIGIAPEDQEVIFEEFTQLDSRLQRQVKGTGLGLPLTRKLAGLLGGEVAVASALGIGSTFSVTLPLVGPLPSGTGPSEGGDAARPDWEPDPDRVPVLVLEDSPEEVHVYQRFLRDTPFQLFAAASIHEARQVLGIVQPRVVILDIMLRGEDSWSFLAELKREERTRRIPVLVATDVDDHQKALALGADEYTRKPVDAEWLVRTLGALAGAGAKRALIIDDDAASRYLLRTVLRDTALVISEAAGGSEGLAKARTEGPDVIFCDLFMPGMGGAEVLEALAADPATRGIPVVMNTVKKLTREQRQDLEARAVAVLSKESFSSGDALGEVRRALTKAGIET